MVVKRSLPLPHTIYQEPLQPGTAKMLQKISGLSAAEKIIDIRANPVAYQMYLLQH